MFLGLFKSKVKVVKIKKRSKKVKAVKKLKSLKARAKRKTSTRAKKTTVRVKKAPQQRKVMPKVIGKITHYFPHVKAGVVLITKGKLFLGDTIQIKGHTTDFKQKVTSMQIDNVPIKEAGLKQEVGLLVKSRVRHNDIVYKL